MNKIQRYISPLVFTAVTFISLNVHGQDLERIGEEKALSVNGGINLNQIFYAVDGIEQRRDPYSYYLSGNLAIDLYGWSVPFSFSLSNQNSSFQQPFNQYGLHPTYKWVTAHLGWASMNFSPYTLNGHLFLGAGVETTPTDKWSISGMYGRLQKAVVPDTIAGTLAAYQRMGFGLKASYGTGADHVDIILFRAKDDATSIPDIGLAGEVLPEENLVLSIAAAKSLFSRLILSGEIAGSAITRDTRLEESESNEKLFNYAGKLFTPRVSSAYYKAYKTGLTYQGGKYSIGLGYERIDPGYRTLGAYYFNNDLENITANATIALMSGKINLGVNTGVQRDNLDDAKISAMERWVGSLNVTYAVNEKLNLNAAYSNFQTFTNIRSQFEQIGQLTPYDNLDTLNYTQISQNANLSIVYIMKASKEKRQSLNMNISFQDAADKQGQVEQNTGTQFYNVNTAYSMAFVPRNMSVTAALNYSRNESGIMTSSTVGPTIALNRSFLERKLRSTFSASWNSSLSNGVMMSKVLNFRLMGGYTLNKKHNINLNLVSLTRTTETEQNAQSFTEFTGTLGYSFNF